MLNDLLGTQEDDELSAELDGDVIGGPGIGYRIKPSASSIANKDDDDEAPVSKFTEKRKPAQVGLTTSSKRPKRDPVDLTLDGDDEDNPKERGKDQSKTRQDRRSSTAIDSSKSLSRGGRSSRTGEVSDDSSCESDNSHPNPRRHASSHQHRIKNRTNSNGDKCHSRETNYDSDDGSCSCEEHSSLDEAADSAKSAKSSDHEHESSSRKNKRLPPGTFIESEVVDASKRYKDSNNNKHADSGQRQARSQTREKRSRMVTQSSPSPHDHQIHDHHHHHHNQQHHNQAHRDHRPHDNRRHHSSRNRHHNERVDHDRVRVQYQRSRPEYPIGRPSAYEMLLDDIFQDACFFQMKSCNYENIEISKSMGVWSTPVRNDTRLNQAFHEFRSVILVFSVKQSGKFQGFARVTSESSRSLPIRWHLPAGFDESQLGGVFKLDWISGVELPFHRSSHLVNRLNENKPVKIARDGQELEPMVGEKLCRLFDQDPSIDLVPIVRLMRRQINGHRSGMYVDECTDSTSPRRHQPYANNRLGPSSYSYGAYNDGRFAPSAQGYVSHGNSRYQTATYHQASMGYGNTSSRHNDDYTSRSHRNYDRQDGAHYDRSSSSLYHHGSTRDYRDRRIANQHTSSQGPNQSQSQNQKGDTERRQQDDSSSDTKLTP